MDSIDRIFSLMSEFKISAAQLTRDAGLTNGLLSQWKQRKQKPSVEALLKIADYFNVTIDYLLCKSEQKEKPIFDTEDEFAIELNDLIKDLSQSQLEQVRDYVRSVAGRKKEEK